MIKAFLKFILSLLGLGDLVKEEVAHGQAVDEGKLEERNAELQAENDTLAGRPVTDADLVRMLRDKAARERKDQTES